MSKDLKYIQNIIEKEIRNWTRYRKETIDEWGKDAFIKDMSKEVLEHLRFCDYDVTKDKILEYFSFIASIELSCRNRDKLHKLEEEFEEKERELIQQIEYWKFRYYNKGSEK